METRNSMTALRLSDTTAMCVRAGDPPPAPPATGSASGEQAASAPVVRQGIAVAKPGDQVPVSAKEEKCVVELGGCRFVMRRTRALSPPLPHDAVSRSLATVLFQAARSLRVMHKRRVAHGDARTANMCPVYDDDGHILAITFIDFDRASLPRNRSQDASVKPTSLSAVRGLQPGLRSTRTIGCWASRLRVQSCSP
eukprot:m.300962 g.300962  ORF g.300962 m.300962 type:complete len:196 (-) comp22992_c0_seq1:416-1003(-)